MGFEPTTSTLARLRSTPELRPRHTARGGAPIIALVRRFSRPLKVIRKPPIKALEPAVGLYPPPLAGRGRERTALASPATRAIHLLRLKTG